MTSQEKPPAGPRRMAAIRRGLLIAVGLILLGGLGVGGYRVYRQMKKDHLLKNARQYFREHRHNEAGLSAMEVFAIDPGNLEATTLMAELTETLQPSAGLRWRRRLLEIQPNDVEQRIAFGDLALRCNNVTVAREALVKPPPRARDTAAFQDLAGRVATASGDLLAAQEFFVNAVTLAPEHGLYRMRLATLRLQSNQIVVRHAARAELEKLREKPDLRLAALRTLVEEAVAHGDLSRALLLAQELRVLPEANVTDRLLYLSALRRLRHPSYDAELGKLQKEAVRNPVDIYALANWMNANGQALDALEWTRRLPPKVSSALPVPVVMAESYVALKDWRRIKPLLTEVAGETGSVEAKENAEPSDVSQPVPNWGAWEYMRLALLSRSLFEEEQAKDSALRWIDAVKAAGRRPDALQVLARAALDWKWETQANELLWTIAASNDNAIWALQILNRRYTETGSTRNLLKVSTRMAELTPKDAGAHNNVAALSLLLNTNMEAAVKLAEEVHAFERANPAYASTYAFALYLQGRTDEGLQIMKSIIGKDLALPAYAAYYGVLLAASGSAEEAAKYLQLASAATLLPEEREMVEKARAKLGLHSSQSEPPGAK